MLKKGVIEGFYGRTWTWAERARMVEFLSENQFSSYWYAPKADDKLRKYWSENWVEQELSQLNHLRHTCSCRQIQFGIGLSPLGLYDQWRFQGKQKLHQRLEQIASLEPDGLALLFDDMQGDLPDLADIQCEMAHFVKQNIDVKQLIVCPGYYSFDPVLEELFGKMPDNYWNDLGEKLDRDIDLFWTGDKVISDEYPKKGLRDISKTFKRKLIIWDNSIVNDGRKTSPFLNIQSMHSLSDIEGEVKGLIVNPMNAPGLSEIPLMSLNITGTKQQRLEMAIELCAPELKDRLFDNLVLFNEKGRDKLTPREIELLDQAFRPINHPVAKNIISWLEGEYQFDPACLT